MALGLLAKLIMTRQLRFEDGQIELKGIRMTLVPAFFVGELTRYFYDQKRLYRLYLLSWLMGFKLVGMIKEQFNLDTPSKVYNFGMDLAEAEGIGLYKTYDYMPGRYTHFVIADNPFLKYLKDVNTDEPIDYFISGGMGGGGCFVHQQLTQNIETKCILRGDAHCDFLTGTEDELKKRGLWDEVRRRYILDKIYPLQKRFYDAFFEKKEDEVLEEIIEEALKI